MGDNTEEGILMTPQQVASGAALALVQRALDA
jgi:hypothetical protein